MNNMTETSAGADLSKRNIFSLSDILEYLDQVESHLRCPSVPSSECHYSYQSDNDSTFYKYVGATLAKPMLRTLIYGGIAKNNAKTNTDSLESIDIDSEVIRLRQRTEKMKLDERIREERVLLEFERMSSFVLQSLRPAVMDLDEDLRNTFVPALQDQIKQIEVMSRNVESGKKIEGKSLIVFSRLASGRQYKGQLHDMVGDLFPHLMEKYKDASQRITDRDVFERLIRLDLTNDDQASQGEDFHSRRIRAAIDCLDMFYPISSDTQTLDSTCDDANSERGNLAESSILSGKLAEESCLRHIQEKHQGPILSNVFINTRRNSDSNEKYKPPRQRRNKSTVIWSDIGGADRHRVCSEFDVLLLKESYDNDPATPTHFVESIWEVKRTISPSTLYDILTKKLEAIELLLDDKSAELTYQDEEEASISVPFSQAVRQQSNRVFTFGIYGLELLQPANAADSIRSVAGANVVSSNLNEVVRSIERCTTNKNSLLLVEVDTERTLDIVKKLKSLIRAKQKLAQKRIQILIYVEKEVDFL